MKTVDVLVKAKELIQDPTKWMQGDFTNDDQTCFCGLGAVAKAMNLTFAYEVVDCEASKLLKSAAMAFDPHHNPDTTFAPFNDSHSHTEVMQAFDKAIYLAQIDEGVVVKL